MTTAEEALKAIMKERNTWARDLADMRDERDSARKEMEEFKASQAETLEWATNRVEALETAIQRVLEAEVDGDQNLTQAIRNLRAVWARA